MAERLTLCFVKTTCSSLTQVVRVSVVLSGLCCPLVPAWMLSEWLTPRQGARERVQSRAWSRRVQSSPAPRPGRGGSAQLEPFPAQRSLRYLFPVRGSRTPGGSGRLRIDCAAPYGTVCSKAPFSRAAPRGQSRRRTPEGQGRTENNVLPLIVSQSNSKLATIPPVKLLFVTHTDIYLFVQAFAHACGSVICVWGYLR